MAETKTIDLEVKSNLGGSIAELKALKRELKNASVGSDEFKKIFGQIDDLEDKIKSAKNTSSDWVDSIESAGGPLGMLGGAINKAKVATQSFGGALKATGIGLIVGLLGGLAAAFSENEGAMKKLQPLLNGISKIFQGIFRVVEPLFNILVDMALNALPMVTNAFGAVYSAVSTVIESFGIIGKAIGQLMKGDFSEAWKTAKTSVTDFGKNYDDSLKRFNDGTKELTKNEKEEAEKRRLQREKEAADKKARDDKAAAIEKARFEKQKTEREKDKEIQDGLDLEQFERDNVNKEKADKKVTDDFARMSSGLKLQRDESKKDYDQKLKDDQAFRDAKLAGQIELNNAIGSALGALSQLFAQGTAASKIAALAEIAIGTGTGFINALDIAQKGAKATGPAAPFAFPIFYATQLAAVLGAASKAKNILSQVKGGGGSGLNVTPPAAPSVASAAPAAPSFNVVGTSGINQIAQGLGNQSPVQAYVVGSQVTTQQALDRNIVRTATLGG